MVETKTKKHLIEKSIQMYHLSYCILYKVTYLVSLACEYLSDSKSKEQRPALEKKKKRNKKQSRSQIL